MGKTLVSGNKQNAGEIVRITGGGGGGVADTFFGTDGEDFFDGAVGNDTIYGAGGNDSLIGGNQSDRVFGGSGDDRIETGRSRTNSFDTAFGGDGNDTIYGGSDTDTLYGGTGDDWLFNNESHFNGERFYGEAGSDRIFVTLSNHAVPILVDAGPDDASDGDDRVIVSGRYEVVTATLGNGMRY